MTTDNNNKDKQIHPAHGQPEREQVETAGGKIADKHFTCPECQAGQITLKHLVYYTWSSGQLITVPDFPAWVCDLCGMREYDQKALTWLKIILDPHTGRKNTSKRPNRKPPSLPPIQPEA